MITCGDLRGQKVGVLGLGKSGIATIQFLIDNSAHPIVWDDGEASVKSVQKQFGDTIEVCDVSSWPWEELACMVLAPGIPYTHPKPHAGVSLAHEHKVEIVGDIELLYRACPNATYVAITGTNGKSTTTSLIAHILQSAGKHVAVGGNLGMPALGLEPLGDDGIYVLELSSYQLDLVRSTAFDIAVLLNFSPDHIDRHGDMDGYIAAKKHIFERQGKEDVAIVGVDDAYSEAVCRELIAGKEQHIIPIMTTQKSGEGIWVENAVLHNPFDDLEYDVSECEALRGLHNHQNAAAAYAVCMKLGTAHDDIVAGMKSFGGLIHRMQLVAQYNGVRFVNDSKATNADAAAKSLESYDRIHWIVGGVAKDGGIESLSNYFPKMIRAYLIGESEEVFAKSLESHVHFVRCGSMENAFSHAVEHAQAGDVVLLAPACASFDQYKNFEARGDAFIGLVREYANAKEEAHAV